MAARRITSCLHNGQHRPLPILLSSPSQTQPTSLPNQQHPHAQQRCLHARTPAPAVPNPIPFVPDAPTFLKLIGRDMHKHADKFPTWASLFTQTSPQLRDAGLEPPRARKYLLHWREKFRHGEFGIGGDVAHVNAEGEAEIALVEVPWELAREIEKGNLAGSATEMKEAPTGGLTQTPGTRLCVLNVPFGTTPRIEPAPVEAENVAETTETASEEGPAQEATTEKITKSSPKQQPAAPKPLFKPILRLPANILRACRPVNGVKHLGTSMILGPYLELIKGSGQKAAVLRPREGMWEHRRGQKVDGGERRKAEVRAKRVAKERRSA